MASAAVSNLGRNPKGFLRNVQVSRGGSTGYGEHRAINGFLGVRLRRCIVWSDVVRTNSTASEVEIQHVFYSHSGERTAGQGGEGANCNIVLLYACVVSVE